MLQPGLGPSRLTLGLLTSWCTKQNEANEKPLMQGWTQGKGFSFFFFFSLSGLWWKLGWYINERRKFCGGQKNLDGFGFETRPRKAKGSLTITGDPWATWVLTAWVHFNWAFSHWLVLQYYRTWGGLNSWILRNCMSEGLTRNYTWIFNCTEVHCP